MATVPTARERLCFLADLLRELRLSTSLSTSTGTRNHSTMNGRIDEGLDHVAALLLREPPSPPEDEPPPVPRLKEDGATSLAASPVPPTASPLAAPDDSKDDLAADPAAAAAAAAANAAAPVTAPRLPFAPESFAAVSPAAPVRGG